MTNEEKTNSVCDATCYSREDSILMVGGCALKILWRLIKRNRERQ